MLNGELVDLSISTDDEETKPKAGGSGNPTQNKPHNNHGSFPDQFVDLDRAPRKKRKLSPPRENNAEKLTVRTTAQPATLDLSLPTVKATDYFLPIDDDDPIVWTSSPKQNFKPNTKTSSQQQSRPSLSDSDASLPDEQWLRMAAAPPSHLQKRVSQIASGKTIFEKPKSKRGYQGGRKVPTKPRLDRSRGEKADSSGEGSIIADIPKVAKTKKPKLTGEEKAAVVKEKEKAKAAAKAIKVQEQEELKERKRLLKEEEAREKQKEKDRAEVNKLKLDKKLSTPEMIVDLPISIGDTTVDTQIRECLRKIGVEISSYQSPVLNLIKWRRKVNSRFNAETGAREKLRVKEIEPEKHVMCLLSANEFVRLATSDANDVGQHLDEHVSQIRSVFNDCQLIYLIEGLDAWMRKNRNAKNRAYQAAVLGQPDLNALDSTVVPDPGPKRRKPRVETVDEDVIEDSLVRLQVMNRCLVHHAAATVETAEWVAHFTEQISQIPYR